MFGLRMRKMLCAAGAALICCTAFAGCGEEEEKKLSKYQLRTEITASNSSAKSIYTGVQAAITDMNAEDADISDFKGRVFNYTGRDFQFDGPPQAGASSEEKFRYRVYVYFTDIKKLDNISISFNNDGWASVECVAVMRTEDEFDTEIYGCHPHQLTVDDFKSIKSMDDAVKYAKGER